MAENDALFIGDDVMSTFKWCASILCEHVDAYYNPIAFAAEDDTSEIGLVLFRGRRE